MGRSTAHPAPLPARIRPIVRRILQDVRRRASAHGDSDLIRTVLTGELGGLPTPVVAVIDDHGGLADGGSGADVLAVRPEAVVHRLATDQGDSMLHVALAAIGPVDLLIDAARGAGRMRRARQYVFAVRPGGVVIMVQLCRPDLNERQCSELGRLLNDADVQASRPDGEQPAGDRLRFRGAVRSARLQGNSLVLVGARALDLSLRVYNDVLTAPGQVVTTGSIILPETCRHGARTRLHNQHVTDLAPTSPMRRDRPGSPSSRTTE